MKSVNSDTAYDFIHRKILSGEFPPGQTLATAKLAADIGISRTPVRDALWQLEKDGLVTIEPHLGARVRTVTLREFREMGGVRIALETYAAGLAATNRRQDQVTAMERALQTMAETLERIATSGETEELVKDLIREDVRFHLSIIEAAGNQLLMAEITRLQLVSRVVSGGAFSKRASGDVSNRRTVHEEHQRILDAIRNRDAEGARKAMEHHLNLMVEKGARLMAESEPSPLSHLVDALTG